MYHRNAKFVFVILNGDEIGLDLSGTEMVWICADEGYRELSWIKWRRTSRGLV